MLIRDFTLPGIDMKKLTAKEGFVFGDIHQKLRGITVSFTGDLEAIAAAKSSGSNLLVIHERLFFPTDYSRSSLDNFLCDQINLPRINALVDAGITVFVARDSIEAPVMRRAVESALGLPSHQDDLIAAYDIPETTTGSFAQMVMDRLELEQVRLTGKPDKVARTLCIVNGGAGITRSADSLIATFRQKPDVILCGETDEYPQWATNDMDIGMVQIGHIFMDNIGLKLLTVMLRQHLPEVPVQFFEIKTPWRIA
jgi:putative NIF3 family GTP cyclohydrolase 1 type 2